VVSPTERQSFIARVRTLAKGCADAWVALEAA
ncbi:MAG: glycine--tRNA ligase subunit alpha, partial [Rhodobacteraceae bacterium]|nr:glycine--tRNA ligase subunit alpha [Paracoccaceae bacterium]